MIEGVSLTNDSPAIKTGGGSTPSPRPSSPVSVSNTSNTSNSPDAAVEVSIDTPVNAGSTAAEVPPSSNRQTESQNLSPTPGAETTPTAKEQQMEKEFRESVEELNLKMNRLDRQVHFKLDKKIDKHYISVIDKESEEVIKEFPPQEIRAFIARFDEFNSKLDNIKQARQTDSLFVNLET